MIAHASVLNAPVRIGCSGWMYKHWRGLFYPEGLPVKRWFEYYAGEQALRTMVRAMR
jgi:uncharacterized protein YecE (DUF72 family)